jgi:hypothetical protein
MATWTTDIRHLPRDDDEAPAEARRRAAFTREVVEAATSPAVRGSWVSAVPCVGVIGGKPCAALAKVSRAPKKDEVTWACETSIVVTLPDKVGGAGRLTDVEIDPRRHDEMAERIFAWRVPSRVSLVRAP